jgi:serine phosphatase RsbU (regulator of sigma subunit)
LAAVETAAVVLGAFREAAHDEPDLVGLGERLERSVSRVLSDEKFVTAVLAEIGTDHEVLFLNYGHPPPMVVRRNGAADFPVPPAYAPPLGLGGAPGSETPKPFSVRFAPGEQLLLYTEARDEDGTFYPLGERAHLLKEPDAQSALDSLREDLVRHTAGPLHDDAAMLLLRYHGHADTDGEPSPPG